MSFSCQHRVSLKDFGYGFDRIYHYRWMLRTHMLMPLAGFMQKYAHGRLLDIGCGDKPYQRLAPGSVQPFVGIDTNRVPNRADIFGSVTALPIKTNCMDTVLCVWVLDDVPEPELIFHEVHRVMRPEGVFLLVANQTDTLHFEPNDYFRFTRYAIQHLAEKAGLRVLEVHPIGGVWIMIGMKLLAYVASAARRFRPLRILQPMLFAAVNAFCFLMDRCDSPKYDLLGNVYAIIKD